MSGAISFMSSTLWNSDFQRRARIAPQQTIPLKPHSPGKTKMTKKKTDQEMFEEAFKLFEGNGNRRSRKEMKERSQAALGVEFDIVDLPEDHPMNW